MYRICDRKEAVKNIQRMLFHTPTGRLSSNDIKKINEIQRRHGIGVTNAVDYETFRAIVSENRLNSLICKSERFVSDNFEFPYSFGDRGNAVQFINMLLAKLIRKYNIMEEAPCGSEFNEKTVRCVMMLCDIFGFDKVEYINEVLYVRLLIECGCQ